MIQILIPVDISKNALHAVAYTGVIFEKTPCTMYLLRAYESHFSNLFSDEYDDEWPGITTEDRESESGDFLKEVKKATGNPLHEFKIISSFDSLTEAMDSVLSSKNIHYITEL